MAQQHQARFKNTPTEMFPRRKSKRIGQHLPPRLRSRRNRAMDAQRNTLARQEYDA